MIAAINLNQAIGAMTAEAARDYEREGATVLHLNRERTLWLIAELSEMAVHSDFVAIVVEDSNGG